MKFLFVEKDQNIRDIYVMKLEADFGAEVLEAANAKEAADILESNLDLSLVISDFDIATKRGENFYNFVKHSPIDVPYIILGNNDLQKYSELKFFSKDNPGNRRIYTPIDAIKFKESMIEALKASGYNGEFKNLTGTDFTPVKIRNFIRFNTIPVDIFIKLSATKFVKLLHQDEMYASDIIEKYVEKGIESLYIRENEYGILANLSVKNLLRIYDRKSLSEDQKQAIQLMALEDIHHQVKDIGLTEETVQLTKRTMEASVAVVKKNPSIWKMLSKMKSSGDYIYDHSLRLSYICAAIARHTDWNSDSTLYKLSLASMMHDMTLSDHDLARIETLDDPNIKNFSDEQIEEYKKHPMEAAELVKNDKTLPRDVHFIIMQHHERPSGDGFPRGLSKLRIAPLACIFICAHELISEIDKLGGEFTIENRNKVIEEMNKTFRVGNFKKPFEGMKKAFE